jgi:hypothetical protein
VANNITEGFSVSHAAILDGTTGAEAVDGDIYGVRSASLQLDTDSYDNTGDDGVLSTWYWFNKATLTVQGGYVPFATIALLSGSKMTSSGAVGQEFYSIPLWEQRMLNVQPRPVLVRVPAKDSNGVLRTLDFVLFKVQFQPFSFDGPTYKSGLLLNYTGSALLSAVTETGATYLDSVTGQPSKAIGRLVSRPQV